jgi:ParB/RepB/Spo0J family partition protein
MFKESIDKMGVQQPILVLKENETLWLVDGLHRLDEAKMRGWKSIDAVVVEGTLKDVQLRNLLLNRLRGKTKSSEMVKVISDLWKTHNVPIETICERTGLKRDYVEKMIQIGDARHEVWEALDNDEIKVCHAYELSRLLDASVQLKMLHQTRVYKISCKDLKEVVDEAIALAAEQKEKETGEPQLIPPRARLATCHFCQGQFPPEQLYAPPMCQACYGAFMGIVQQAKLEAEKEAEKKAKEAEEKRKEVITSE